MYSEKELFTIYTHTMKTIQLKSIVLTLGLLLSIFDVTGQKVITNHPSANEYPVIDLSELSPLNCLLTTPEAADRRKLMNEQKPSESDYLAVGSTISRALGSWNIKMSPQFQVMRNNITVEATGWVNGYNLCKQYNAEGGKAGEWRLPTQRELFMIHGLHPQLLEQGDFTAFSNATYWCATEGNVATTAWNYGFGIINMDGDPKTTLFLVRCIRDL